MPKYFILYARGGYVDQDSVIANIQSEAEAKFDTENPDLKRLDIRKGAEFKSAQIKKAKADLKFTNGTSDSTAKG